MYGTGSKVNMLPAIICAKVCYRLKSAAFKYEL